MPLHDWSRVESGIFHDFHTVWISEIRSALNEGVLPEGYYALAEQHAGGYVADVLALHRPPTKQELTPQTVVDSGNSGGAVVAEAPPATLKRESMEMEIDRVQRRISIRHISSHRIVALLEIVSPGNIDNQNRFEKFVVKTVDAIESGICVLVIDLFRPGTFDPCGMHHELRSRLGPRTAPPASSPPPRSTFACYCLNLPRHIDMYLEQVESDQALPEMPIFLDPKHYVNVPLEATYQEAWKGMPAFWRDVVLGKSVD